MLGPGVYFPNPVRFQYFIVIARRVCSTHSIRSSIITELFDLLTLRGAFCPVFVLTLAAVSKTGTPRPEIRKSSKPRFEPTTNCLQKLRYYTTVLGARLSCQSDERGGEGGYPGFHFVDHGPCASRGGLGGSKVSCQLGGHFLAILSTGGRQTNRDILS